MQHVQFEWKANGILDHLDALMSAQLESSSASESSAPGFTWISEGCVRLLVLIDFIWGVRVSVPVQSETPVLKANQFTQTICNTVLFITCGI